MLGRRSRWAVLRTAAGVMVVSASLVVSDAWGKAGPVLPGKTRPTPKPHGVLVDRGGITLRVFTDATCSVNGNRFTAVSRKYGAKLLVKVQPFSGFGRYRLRPGTATGSYVSTFAAFTDPTGHQFASNYVPPYPIPSGGAIQFGNGGQLIGVGFQPTFNASGSEAIIFTGVMRCHYAHRSAHRVR